VRKQAGPFPPRVSCLGARCGPIRNTFNLRRRELLFWFFVLSYVPGMLLIIAVVDVIGRDLPQHIGAYFSAAWLAGFGVASLYHQNFCCPRCHRFFFRRVRLPETDACKCVHCGLARGARSP
jgi:hypothetical protein